MPAPGQYSVVVVAGPTGSGKSALALALAREYGGEIVNCDSLQLYRGLDLGTAKTPPAARCGIPHHLIDILEPSQVFNAGDYAAAAREALHGIAARGRPAIIAGGTGFYLRALLDGLAEGPKRDDRLRERLAARESRKPGGLHRLLRRLDAETAARIHSNDVNKLIRVLEIRLLARRPASDLFREGRRGLEGYAVRKIALNPPRPALHAAIAARTRAMFESGLLDEVRALIASGISPRAKAFESIGYRQCIEVLKGRLSADEAVQQTIIATRQYAKRQMTWLRRERSLVWIDGFGDTPEALGQARGVLEAEAWLHPPPLIV